MSTRPPAPPAIVEDHGLPLRSLQRPDQLRALAHPRRLQIMDLLIAEGPLTASECAAALGDSAASCSYHLRQLARFGFVEEAEGGHGRSRPWRWVALGTRIDAGDSPAERSAAEALEAVVEAGKIDRIRAYQQHRSSEPWRTSASSSSWSIRMTEAELQGLSSSIAALLAPLQQRTFAGEAPEGSRVVDVLAYLMPRPDRHAAEGPTTDDEPAAEAPGGDGQTHA
ncbi:helix-turn-helix domain-containing protein [Brachybacterium huguangmaarense]|uniref:Helix-turn-helix domain-containing protein n=1 Tax=Brachybacterium huguangmaarense TaxID=1652028 RepID=A0ABY6G274_9MICO|nr:helix-turn-helix domain-containing protein [Brachybacterium huguangmaarense]UYG16759.1 helix-turn-helix domain-containing protein [Brachybacterium huguangmaarense]